MKYKKPLNVKIHYIYTAIKYNKRTQLVWVLFLLASVWFVHKVWLINIVTVYYLHYPFISLPSIRQEGFLSL